MRNLRFRSAASAATTALVAALALTACGQSDAVGAAPKPDAKSTAASSTDKPDAQKTDQPQDSTDQSANKGDAINATKAGSDTGEKSGARTSGKSKSKTPGTCTPDNTKITVTKVSRPINHLLVTATNAGSGTCYAYYAPLLGFDDAQSVTQINESSQPQAVVTLSPGQSAYASIALGGGDGSPTIAAYKLSISFSGRDNQGTVGSVANLTLPKGTRTNNDTSVSYWQATMADALTW